MELLQRDNVKGKIDSFAFVFDIAHIYHELFDTTKEMAVGKKRNQESRVKR